MNLANRLSLPIFRTVGEVADAASRECYVVGGYVRDLLLKRHSKDIDFVTVGSGIEIAAAVAKALGKGAHLNVFRTYGTAQVRHGDDELEFVGARRSPTVPIRATRLSRMARSTMISPAVISRSTPWRYVSMPGDSASLSTATMV